MKCPSLVIAMKDIDFFVIGAQKAGTTSVHKYLATHEDIYVPPEKEVPFFSEDQAYLGGINNYFDKYFGSAKHGAHLGTVTPQYMMSPDVPCRIRKTYSDAKLIAILRDPIERAYSHYHMAVRVHGEIRTFQDAVAEQIDESSLATKRCNPIRQKDFVVFGEYGRILTDFYRYFPKEQILVLYMDELITNPQVFMDKVFNFIGVKKLDVPNIEKKYHTSTPSRLSALLAHIALRTKVRHIGKILPGRMRDRLRFWLGLHRSSHAVGVDSSATLSPNILSKLVELYSNDAAVIQSLTGEIPYWVREWQQGRFDL